MMQNWYEQWGRLQPATCWHPSISPSHMLQQCPRCEGLGCSRIVDDPDSQTECPFCFGVGVVKVSVYTGNPEAVEPPAEPSWHRNAREDAERGEGTARDADA